MFQFYNLIPSLTARENVSLVTDIAEHPMPPEEALRLVGLGAPAGSLPRRSFRAGSSSGWPSRGRWPSGRDVLLCDEPTGALDATTGKVVLEALARINEEIGTSTVIITHNAPIAAMAHRVITLGDGRIVGERRNATRMTAKDLTW